jgi:hypothetical protein
MGFTFIFSLIYFGLFIYSMNAVFKERENEVLIFFIFSLPIYITALSTTYQVGLGKTIPFLQFSKELLVIITLLFTIYRINKKVIFHLYDKLVLIYLLLIIFFTFLPIGGASIFQKWIAAKSITFFALVYFIGRFISVEKVNINKYFNLICLISIAAGVVVLVEAISGQYLQIHTGYADFMLQYFNQPTSGNYGLSWTFETDNGLKRFASFFSMPLEHAAATIISASVIAALITTDSNKIILNKFIVISILATLISIIFALSRASLISYFIVIYVYASITDRKKLVKFIHYALIFISIIFLIYVRGDIYEFIINTINFTNSSSLTHIVAWLQGIDTIGSSPFGLGLGASGNVANVIGDATSGENEFFVIGVQVGFLPMLLYLLLYIYIIYLAFKMFKSSKGKIKKMALVILLIKIGLIIPSLSSELESYIYISYITWFFIGYFINMISISNTNKIEIV